MRDFLIGGGWTVFAVIIGYCMAEASRKRGEE